MNQTPINIEKPATCSQEFLEQLMEAGAVTFSEFPTELVTGVLTQADAMVNTVLAQLGEEGRMSDEILGNMLWAASTAIQQAKLLTHVGG